MEAHALQAADMDRMYRGQKRIYDLTRKYYLLGRDQTLDRIAVAPGDHLCEVGTGTARNLVRLAHRAPHGHYHGVDISEQMLSQARRNVARAGLGDRIELHRGAAEQLDHRALGLAAPFQAILFSYCLTILPAASVPLAVAAAWDSLAPGGTIYCVEFGPLPAWPRPVRWLFKAVQQLGLLHHDFEGYRQDVVDTLDALTTSDHVARTPLYGGYAQLITVRKPIDEIESAFGRALIDQTTEAARVSDGPFDHRGDT